MPVSVLGYDVKAQADRIYTLNKRHFAEVQHIQAELFADTINAIHTISLVGELFKRRDASQRA